MRFPAPMTALLESCFSRFLLFPPLLVLIPPVSNVQSERGGAHFSVTLVTGGQGMGEVAEDLSGGESAVGSNLLSMGDRFDRLPHPAWDVEGEIRHLVGSVGNVFPLRGLFQVSKGMAGFHDIGAAVCSPRPGMHPPREVVRDSFHPAVFCAFSR